MQCHYEGRLRTYIDHALPADELDAVANHVGECARCQNAVDELRASAQLVAEQLEMETTSPIAVNAALSRTQNLLRTRTRRSFWQGIISSRRRLATAVAVLMAALITLTPVRMMAADALAVFRVQKFAAVTIDPTQIPMLPNPGNFGDIRVTGREGVSEASIAEAAASVDFPLRQPGYLPTLLSNQPQAYVTKPVEVLYKVDLGAIKGYLTKIGADAASLPTALDGATIRGSVPASVAIVYGSITAPDPSRPDTSGSNFLLVGQSRGPTIEVPDDVDIDLVRQQVLAIPLLPPDLAAQLRAIKDWRHTLVVPVRAGTQRDVTVAGVPGLLINHDDQGRSLLWQKDGVLYVLVSNLADGELLRIGNSLR